jgi:hypothetical protein
MVWYQASLFSCNLIRHYIQPFIYLQANRNAQLLNTLQCRCPTWTSTIHEVLITSHVLLTSQKWTWPFLISKLYLYIYIIYYIHLSWWIQFSSRTLRSYTYDLHNMERHFIVQALSFPEINLLFFDYMFLANNQKWKSVCVLKGLLYLMTDLFPVTGCHLQRKREQ